MTTIYENLDRLLYLLIAAAFALLSACGPPACVPWKPCGRCINTCEMSCYAVPQGTNEYQRCILDCLKWCSTPFPTGNTARADGGPDLRIEESARPVVPR